MGKLIKIVVCLLYFNLPTEGGHHGAACKLPTGPGRCVSESNCPHLQVFLRLLPPYIFSTMRDYLQPYYCDKIHFCCPLNVPMINQSTTALHVTHWNPTIAMICTFAARYQHHKTIKPPATTQPTTTTTTNTTPTKPLQTTPNIQVRSNLLPLIECGIRSDENRVKKGEITGINQYPWNVLLGYRPDEKGRMTRCSGSLIHERYVLTAAHCVTEGLYMVVLGEHNITSDPDCQIFADGERDCTDPVQLRSIEQTLIHPNFNHTSRWNDIALLKLSKPADITKDNVEPICLPFDLKLRKKKLEGVEITGWGLTEDFIHSDVLRFVRVPVADLNTCNDMLQNVRVVETQICTGGPTQQNTCPGDSGSPLQHLERIGKEERMVQYGIVSIGNCMVNDYLMYGLHTRVDHYLDWIQENVQ